VSPALIAFSRFNGPDSATQASDAKIASFTRAVIEHQPLDYARTVLEGMAAYITPVRIQFANRSELGPSYNSFFHGLLFEPKDMAFILKEDLPWYGVHAYHKDQSLLNTLLAYETDTRVTGPLMAILMLLSLFAPFAPRGPARQVGTLLFLIAWAELIIPPATHWWDARYVIPALGPLSASAAIGAWQCERLARRLGDAVRPRPGTPATTPLQPER